jgi:ATP-dependent Lon protease
MGELSFDGTINPVTGIMGVALDAVKFGIKNIVIPFKNYVNALENIPDITIFPMRYLSKSLFFLLRQKN